VEQALFQLSYRNFAVNTLGTVGLSGLVALAVHEQVAPGRVWGWAGFMGVLSLVLIVWHRWFGKQFDLERPPQSAVQRWWRVNLWIMGLHGLGWGGLGFLFVPGEGVNNLVVMTSFVGAVAYGAMSNTYELRLFYLSVFIGTGVLMTQIPAAFGQQAPPVLGMCVLYLATMSGVARNAHFTLLESIRLRLANEVLAKKNAENAARAEQANRDKSEFLAAASHDLRQPVHALLLLIEAYRHQVPAAAEHPLILHIAAAGQAIGTLFNALMELSRLESGMEKTVLTHMDLAEELLLLTSRLRPLAHRKSLPMRSFVAKSCATMELRTDKLLFERIVGNLLSNAVRYTRQGGVLLSLRPAHGGDGLWLEVWDTGLGIAAADQARIFDPYVQIANRERDRAAGLGLGLAIVRHASALLGFGVSLRSRLGRGSCFRLHLPGNLITHTVAAALSKAVHQPAMVSPAAWLKGKRLLLVDDDVMIQRAMQALLGSWGLEVRSASQGDASVLAVCQPDWVPDCVLCDFRLPGTLDGVAMLDLLQEHFPRVVGILQTGELAHTVQARAEDAGYMVLFKPVEASILASTLASVLSNATHDGVA
jgi:signal transduction histidine kinase/ActR/RegA family two-component response regulator